MLSVGIFVQCRYRAGSICDIAMGRVASLVSATRRKHCRSVRVVKLIQFINNK